MRKMSMSYNNIKGSIPSSIKNLKNIKLFHLHGNQLEGDADFFEKDLESFIVDCGSTDKSKRMVQCDTCTECCNEDGDCITLAKTWPDESWKSVKIDASYIILLTILGCWVIMLFISIGISLTKDHLPSMDCPFEKVQHDSIYRFLLGHNILATIIALLTTVFQVVITLVFFRAGDNSSETNDWISTVR